MMTTFLFILLGIILTAVTIMVVVGIVVFGWQFIRYCVHSVFKDVKLPTGEEIVKEVRRY